MITVILKGCVTLRGCRITVKTKFKNPRRVDALSERSVRLIVGYHTRPLFATLRSIGRESILLLKISTFDLRAANIFLLAFCLYVLQLSGHSAYTKAMQGRLPQPVIIIIVIIIVVMVMV
jgi:hypothetical protein